MSNNRHEKNEKFKDEFIYKSIFQEITPRYRASAVGFTVVSSMMIGALDLVRRSRVK